MAHNTDISAIQFFEYEYNGSQVYLVADLKLQNFKFK